MIRMPQSKRSQSQFDRSESGNERVDMSRGDEVEAREPHRRRIMPGQGRVDPVRMEDEADDVVRTSERDLPVLSHTPTTMLTGRRLVSFPQTPGGTPRSVQDCSAYGRFAVLAEDDTDNGEAPTMSQEPRPTRRLVLVGGRSGRESVGRIHFHPKTFSSSDTFFQKQFHPMTISSKSVFIH